MKTGAAYDGRLAKAPVKGPAALRRTRPPFLLRDGILVLSAESVAVAPVSSLSEILDSARAKILQRAAVIAELKPLGLQVEGGGLPRVFLRPVGQEVAGTPFRHLGGFSKRGNRSWCDCRRVGMSSLMAHSRRRVTV